MQQARSFNYSGEKGGGVYDTKPIGRLYSTFSSLYYALSVSMTVMIYEIQYRCIFQRGLYFISSRHQNGQEVTRHTGRGKPVTDCKSGGPQNNLQNEHIICFLSENAQLLKY